MPPKKSNTTSKGKKGKQVRQSTLRIPDLAGIRRAFSYVPALTLLALIAFLFLNQQFGLIDLFSSRNPFEDPSAYDGIYDPDAELADLFHPAVQYWEPAIYGWAQEAHLNPNIVATIIQIESCGNPYVASEAGAQGLVQVMPLHFEAGENQLDLNTNVRAGMQHFRDCLRWSADPNFDGVVDKDPDVGVALACYNGGPSVVTIPRSQWYSESQYYYQWGTGLWGEASRGRSSSSTLPRWLQAGGVNLCNQALEVQEQFSPLDALLRPE